MELTLKILNELVVLPHWQVVLMVSLTLLSLVLAFTFFLMVMHFKVVVGSQEKEIAYLYLDKCKLKHELEVAESALVSK